MPNDLTTRQNLFNGRAESRQRLASSGFTASVWTLSGVVLVACGSVEDIFGLDDGGGGSSGGGVLQVQKSPIQGARLYFYRFDANGDGMLDAREKAAQDAQYPEGFITDATGRANNIPAELHGLPFIADLNGAIDADTGEPFPANSHFRSIADANNEHILASPITDFIAEQMDAGESSADVVAALLGYSPVDLMPEQQQARDNLLADILDFDSYLSVGSGVEALAVYLSEEHDTNADANAQIAAVQNRVSALLIEDASDTLKIANQDADITNTNIVDVNVAIGQYDKHITTITAVSHGGGITYRFIEADPNHAGNYRTAPRETYASFTINQQRGIISVADSVEALEEGTITLLVEVRNRHESEIVEVEITVAAAPNLHPGTNNGADITIGRIAENVIGAATGITGITTTASNPTWEIREATPTGFNFADKFDIVSGEGDTYNLVLKEGASLNFEEIANGVIDLHVRAVEAGVHSNALDFTINVGNAEEGPAEIIIIGHAEAGTTLEALHIAQDPDGVDGAGYRYQWYNADGDIAGATRATYTLPAGTTALAGYGVRVSYTDKTGAVYSTDRHANPYKDKDAIDVAHFSSLVFENIALFNGNIVEGTGVFDFGAGVSSRGLSGSLARFEGVLNDITFSLVDDYAGIFSITTHTGSITIAEDAVFDYETRDTYNLIVKAEHASGAEAYARGTINVIDADEGVTESIIIGHAEAGTTWEVLHLEEDPNGVTSAGYRYQWYNANGDIAGATSTTYTLPTGTTDFASYGVRISYTDGSGVVYSTNRHPDPDKDKDAIDIAHSGIVFEDLAQFSGNIVEGSGVFDFGFGVSSTALSGSLARLGGSPLGFTYALVDDYWGAFTINPYTAAIAIADGAVFDYETQNTYNLIVKAEHESGVETYIRGTVNVIDADEGVTESIIIGHAEAGTTWEVLHLEEDPNGVTAAGYRYQWYNADGDIAGATRATYTLPTGTTDFASYGVRISYTDGSGVVYSTARHPDPDKDKDAIDIAHSGIVFTDINFFNGNVVEGTSVFVLGPGATSASLSGSLAEFKGSLNDITFSLVDDYAGTFTITSHTGAIIITDDAVFDYETRDTYNLIVKAEHASGAEAYARGTINVIDADEGVTESIIIGHAEAGTTWEVLHLEEDPNGVTAAGYRYQWYNANGDIAGATSTTYTIPTGTTDFSGYGVRISYTDGSGAVYSTNRHPDPDKDKDAIDIAHSGIVFTDINFFNGNVVEGTSVFVLGPGATSASLSGSLAEFKGSLNDITFSLIDDYAGTFTITSHTGAIIITDGAVFDYETRDTYNLIVKAEHVSGAVAYARGTINVIKAPASTPASAPAPAQIPTRHASEAEVVIPDEDSPIPIPDLTPDLV